MRSRRDALRLALRGAAGALLAACRTVRAVPADDTGPSAADPCTPVTPGTAAEGWVEVPLADHPALSEVGGQAAVDVDEALLHLLIARTGEDCWVGVWRVCTHGACEVEWEPEAAEVSCPCHGSRFGADGAVLQGPATEALAAYEVGRVGDSLWVRRAG